MPTFEYVALDAKGNEVKAEIEALSSKEAISKIRNKGLFPTKVKAHGAGKKVAVKAAAAAPKRKGANKKIKIKVVTQFARQLSTLQDAGLAILRSLRILEEQQKKGPFKRIIGYVADDIEGGSTLSEALAPLGVVPPSPSFLARYGVYAVPAAFQARQPKAYATLQRAILEARRAPEFQNFVAAAKIEDLSLGKPGEDFVAVFAADHAALAGLKG
mgnify:CR=1 FL=1